MMSPCPVTRGAVTAVLLACSLASAQTTEELPGFDLERLDTNLGRGTLLVGNGELLEPGALSAGLLGHYQRLPLALNDGEQRLDVVRHRATALLAASYGVLPWLEVGAQVPVILWQQGADPTQIGLLPLTAQGLGTPVLQARLGLLSRRDQQPVDLSGDVGVGLPVGTRPALGTDPGLRYHARLTVGANLGWLEPSLEAGVLLRPAILLTTAEGASTAGLSPEIRVSAAAATTGEGVRGELAVRALFIPERTQVALEVLGGVRFPLWAGLDAFVLGGPGLGTALGTPRFRVLVGGVFRMESPPRISFLDENARHRFQVSQATQEVQARRREVRPTPAWELNPSGDTTEGAPAGQGASLESLESSRPYRPGPLERVVHSEEVVFDEHSVELRPEARRVLEQVVRWIQEQPVSKIVLEGHADATEGTGGSNRSLSLRRAQAVRRDLDERGVSMTRVWSQGLGADAPAGLNLASGAEHPHNRRVRVLLVVEEAAITPPHQARSTD